MNGVHDMGGMHGFGPVEPEANEPVFHAPWEGRVLAMSRAMGYAKLWNIDMSRAVASRQLPPTFYLGVTYYEKWALRGSRQLLLERGLVGADEIAAGHSLRPASRCRASSPPPMSAEGADARLLRAPDQHAGALQPGDRVRTKNINPTTHTRLPRYARDKVGMVEASAAATSSRTRSRSAQGENPQWLYTVVFDGRELWGEDADPTLKVSIEAFEPYLEPA